MANKAIKLSEVSKKERHQSVEDLILDMIDESQEDEYIKGIYIIATRGDSFNYAYEYCGMDASEAIHLLERVKIKDLLG